MVAPLASDRAIAPLASDRAIAARTPVEERAPLDLALESTRAHALHRTARMKGSQFACTAFGAGAVSLTVVFGSVLACGDVDRPPPADMDRPMTPPLMPAEPPSSERNPAPGGAPIPDQAPPLPDAPDQDNGNVDLEESGNVDLGAGGGSSGSPDDNAPGNTGIDVGGTGDGDDFGNDDETGGTAVDGTDQGGGTNDNGTGAGDTVIIDIDDGTVDDTGSNAGGNDPGDADDTGDEDGTGGSTGVIRNGAR